MQYPVDCWLLKVLFDWQTLCAGLLALLGALITVIFIWKQIRSAETQAKKYDAQNEISARAVLSLTLSDLSTYAKSCVELLASYLESKTPIPKGTLTPVPSPEAIVALQNCVRYSPPAISDQIANLINKLQVQNARLREFVAKYIDEPVFAFECTDRMVDAADLYAEIDRLYSYARNLEALRKRRPKDELLRAIRLYVVAEDDHPAIKRIIELEKASKN